MANNLIPEELDQLIQEYLTDGVLTDKERAVILRKAEKMGLDRDEIDLYLDAQVQKINQATDAAVRKVKGKTCPYCGGSVPQLAEKCPYCDEYITPQASEELQEIFDNLEEALVDMKSGKELERSKATVERYARKAKMYYGSNPKVQKLLAEVEKEMTEAEKKAKSLARKKTIVNILTYNKFLTAGVIVVLAILLWYMWPGTVTSDPQRCTEAIREALEKNDVETAVSLYRGFDDYKSKLGYSEEDLARAYLKAGDIDKALSLTGKRDPANSFDDDKPIFAEIEEAYLEKGELEKAIGVWDRSGYCAKDNFRILCLCIDKMKEEKTSQEIKNFIIKHMSLFYDSDQAKYQKQLFEYAGIK